MNYKKYQCKQKILPISVEYEVIGNNVFIKLVSESEMKELKVTSLRGLDGLRVSSTNIPSAQDMSIGSQVTVDASFIKPQGLSYLVIDLEGKVGTQLRKQSIPFPIGEVSQKQTIERQKNLKLLKSNTTDKEENYNVMKLDSE